MAFSRNITPTLWLVSGFVLIAGLAGYSGAFIHGAAASGDEPAASPASTTRPAGSSSTDRGSRSSRRRAKRNLIDPELVKDLEGGQTSARDAVEETVTRMRQVAERISSHRDIGSDTRRMQKEIVSGLDAMIEAAENAASSAKKNPNNKRKASRPQKDGRQQPQDRKSTPGTASRRGGGTTERGNKSIENKEPLDRSDLARSWGFLPEQEREALLQGLDESFMPKYREEIARYYRNLAIEAARE